MKVYKYSNRGNREENQDFVIFGSLPDESAVFIVADGMGGYSNGSVASRVVSESILEFVELNYAQFPPDRLLREAVSFSNDSLLIKRIEMSAQKMGCVISVMLLYSGYAYFTWLGDSRIYMYREQHEVYRTEDHSVLNELAKNKTFNAYDLEKYSAVVTKSITGDSPMDEFLVRKVKVEQGDIFILCTDGYYKEFDMGKAIEFDDTKKGYLDSLAVSATDNFSFIKVEI